MYASVILGKISRLVSNPADFYSGNFDTAGGHSDQQSGKDHFPGKKDCKRRRGRSREKSVGRPEKRQALKEKKEQNQQEDETEDETEDEL